MVAPQMGGGRQGQSIETLYVDIAARADKLVQDAEQAVATVINRLDDLEDKNKQVEKSFGRLGKFMRDALAVGTGMLVARMGGTLVNAVMNFGRSMIQANAQMQTFQQSFTVLTGSAEEAGEIIEWVKEQARATPFDVPGLIQASQMLMTWGLDLKEWFTVVGDTAAAMNRPLSQVVNAIGTLASGQTGEAVRRFRDLGINLREFMGRGLEFDAQGAMVTPLEEAIPFVKRILEEKYGGMMESQSKTWAGVMSNMGDTWQELVRVMGKPIFDDLNAMLFDLYNWIEANQEQLISFAETLGEALGGTLTMLVNIVEGFAQIAGWLDTIIGKVLGTPDWMQEGLETGGKLAGIGGGLLTGTRVFWEQALAGEDLEKAAAEGQAAWLQAMLNVIGEVERLSVAVDDMTEDQLVGIRAVEEAWGGAFGVVGDGVAMTDEQMQQMFEFARRGMEAIAAADVLRALEATNVVMRGATAAWEEQNFVVMQVARTYEAARQKFIEVKEAQDALTAAIAAQRAELGELMGLVGEVADKYTTKLDALIKAHEEKIRELIASTAEEVGKIESKAGEEIAEATKQTQDDIASARESFAREQLRARRRFNREWARLLREQNQEVIDAEWEYQYDRENILIDGDERALADLEARYKHEKDVRKREHGDARGDLSDRFEAEEKERQERFNQTIKDLEARLEVEIDNIRKEAAEEVAVKKEALEERLANEDQALSERLQKMGEMLADEIGDNEDATALILELWTTMYGAQVTAALTAGITTRNDLNRTISLALRALQVLQQVAATPTRRSVPQVPGGPIEYQFGGYTPPFKAAAITDPNEWIATAGTTRALERAIGGPLTQQRVRSFAKRRMDFYLHGSGVPAGELRALRSELVRAMSQAGTEF